MSSGRPALSTWHKVPSSGVMLSLKCSKLAGSGNSVFIVDGRSNSVMSARKPRAMSQLPILQRGHNTQSLRTFLDADLGC